MSLSPANVKKVLFVDDNLQFLEMIERLMGNWSQGEWQIFLAQNAGKALIILQEQAIDLAVIDVQMPVVDGIQFLALINRKYPAVQKVTLSAYADDASRAACLAHGAELFLEKPRDPSDLEIIFATLRELARHKPTISGFRGVLRQVSLQDVIQMECLNRNSSILQVNAGQWQGEIFIKDGSIIHAHAGDRNGEAGLNKILGLKGGEFNLRPFTEPPIQTIDGSWEFLLMEAARARDEESENEIPEAPPSVADLPPAPAIMPKPAPPLRPPVNVVAPAKPIVPSAPVVSLPAPAENRPARIDEMVVCSARGEVLYEWQCANAGDRVSFLEFLSRKSLQLGEGLGLGVFDRLEIEGDSSRVVAQLKKDRGVFVRATKTAPRSIE
ncbi:MAG TPA: response regulator [Verrucomicrobiae bacterium]|jgi:CheY-like chemotaxis protein|nr:response regulator [Verrucomicrobiae bacterium]